VQQELRGRQHGRALVYVLNVGNFYGTERMALATLEALGEYEERILLAPDPSGPESVAVAARAAGMTVVRYVTTRTDFTRAILPFMVRHRAIDIIGTGVAQTYICWALAKLLGVRLRQLHVIHGGTEDEHAYGSKHHLNRIPVRVVAVSDFVRKRLIAHGVRDDAIHVIDNFLTDEQLRTPGALRPPYRAEIPGARPVDMQRVRVVVVSRIEPIKRVGLLVDAIERHGLREFVFDVYGSGEELEPLRTRAAPLPNIAFHGFVSEVASQLPEADLLLHLCPQEPFGIVVLEAFRSRLLVVVPDHGGASGLIEDGVTGLRFHAEDVDDLAQTLQRARTLPMEAWQAMADAAHATLFGRYSAAHGARRYREALEAA
jgi:glycosyltransferase involved in cell wall biosynthesis